MSIPYNPLLSEEEIEEWKKRVIGDIFPHSSAPNKEKYLRHEYQKYGLCGDCCWHSSLESCLSSSCRGRPFVHCKTCGVLFQTNRANADNGIGICKKCNNGIKYINNRTIETKLTSVEFSSRISLATYRRVFYRISHERKKKYNPNLTLEYVLDLADKQNYRCALTGIQLLNKNPEGWNMAIPSLDRIDNSKDYEVGNVRWVCLWANIARYVLNDEEFYTFCKIAVDYHDGIIS